MFLPAVSPNRLKMAHKFSTQRYPSKFFIEIYFFKYQDLDGQLTFGKTSVQCTGMTNHVSE